ncbi:MAG: hypothetical protein KQJ78_10915 [Deltaproteobacteria bacterium]|nr:hypothetical protein [Deltaproteobacteria bacterium]
MSTHSSSATAPRAAGSRRRSPGRGETLAGLAVLLLLLIIAAGVWHTSRNFDPSLWGLPAGPAQGGGLLAALAPPGFTPLAPPEAFDLGTLWTKIDGKAELYLPAGFELLETRRWRPTGREGWLETYLFRMKEAQGAFAVYSGQRRSDARPLDLTPLSYASGPAVFAALGPYYLEVVPSGADAAWARASRQMAQAILEALAAVGVKGQSGLGAAGLFPPQGLVQDSLTLLAQDVFGMAGLDQVRTANYQSAQGELTAFLSHRTDAAAAAKLTGDYVTFLTSQGVADLGPAPQLPGSHVLDVLGTFEVVFSQGPYFAGAKGEDRAAAQDLAQRLAKRLAGPPAAPPAGESK